MKTPFLIFLLFLCGGFSAVAQPSGNPLVFGENRLTLITPTLFRLEFAHDGKFIDDPTIFAYDRSNLLPADRFEVRALGGDRYEITTEALRIVYEHDGFPFGLHNFAAYYKLNGKEKKFTNRCIFRNNLGGPVETLDRVTGEIPMQDGLLSRDGWYVIDDERSDLLVDGWLRPRDTRSHVQDQYCFVYGNDYKAALADLGAIGGRVPMTRKYIHGVWYCRYWDYTSEEFLSIIDGYEQNDFPLDNLVFDMGWHTYDAKIGTGHAGSRSWTGYTWERKRIPDPGALIAEVHRRGVTVSLNDHPHDGIRPHEEMYGAFMKDMGADPAKPLLFDLGDRKYMETFFKHAHHTTEDMGVDFWWLDWQQNYLYPEVRGYRSTSLQWINELYYRETERKGLRGAGYSRWAGWGDHRHPIQFSGDLIDFPIVNKRLFLPIRQLLLDSRQGLSFTGPEQLSVRDRILELTRMQGFQSATAFLDILNALATANRKVLMSNLCDSKNIVHTSKSRRIAKVCDYIEKNLCQNIRLTDVAGLVNMSESAFSHFFKKRTNISYITFVNNMRISKACQLLANTTLSASEICYACGFNNKSNFIRIFTKKKNMTPIEYREYISQMLIKY